VAHVRQTKSQDVRQSPISQASSNIRVKVAKVEQSSDSEDDFMASYKRKK
jgi:hypothetical protein